MYAHRYSMSTTRWMEVGNMQAQGLVTTVEMPTFQPAIASNLNIVCEAITRRISQNCAADAPRDAAVLKTHRSLQEVDRIVATM